MTSEGRNDAHPELLVDAAWVREHADDPDIRVIDCDAFPAYRRAHIPGAVALGVHPWLKRGSETKPSPPGAYLPAVPADPYVIEAEPFAEVMGRLGVAGDTTVVAYDGTNGSFATRLWWVLRLYGHARARVLDGGWRAWLDGGNPVTDRAAEPVPAAFTPARDETVLCRLEELKARHADPDVQVMSVLGPAVYRGDANPAGNRRAGRIPGSVNVPLDRLLRDDGRRLRPAGELRALLADAGLTPEKETIVHCQGGIWTTLGVFALTLLGWPRVRAYDAAMAEWANRDDTPLVRG